MQNVHMMKAGIGAVEQMTLRYNLVQGYYQQGWAEAREARESSVLAR